MKLNQSCVFDILKYIEEKLTVKLNENTDPVIEHNYSIQAFSSVEIFINYGKSGLLSKYTKEDLYYALIQLVNFNYIYISSDKNRDIPTFDILDITPAGHIFLATKKMF